MSKSTPPSEIPTSRWFVFIYKSRHCRGARNISVPIYVDIPIPSTYNGLHIYQVVRRAAAYFFSLSESSLGWRNFEWREVPTIPEGCKRLKDGPRSSPYGPNGFWWEPKL